MLTIFLLVLALVGLSVLMLGIRVFFTRKGKFPSGHIEGNKALREKGIKCAKKSF